MLGDVAAANAEGIGVITEALTSVGAVGQPEILAELIAEENLQWEPANWGADSGGVVVCDAESSPRNPSGDVSLSPNELHVVSEILNA